MVLRGLLVAAKNIEIGTMISTLLLTALFGAVWVITAPLRLLPVASLPASISSSITTVGGYFATFYSILPVTCAAITAIIAFVIVIEGGILTYKGIMWIIRKIPGIN
jgi:hypothetical protein